jgi:hypothetical protein
MRLLSQQMLQHVVSTLMESHSLCMSMFRKIIKIIYTVQAEQPVQVNQVQS